jgi:hypothetical protein
LSVLVFGGERTIGSCVRPRRVTPPTMTRLVAGSSPMVWSSGPDPADRRAVRVGQRPTAGAACWPAGIAA